MLFWATILCALFANTMLARWLPSIEGLILYLHVFGFFAILIPLVYTADHSTAKFVFTEFLSSGGYPTISLSVLVGMSTSTAALIGKCEMRSRVYFKKLII